MKEDTRIGLIGFFLMILPLFSYLISSSLIQTSRIVSDTSFVVQPGETKYLGYNYVTAELECTQLVLTGEVSVEGEGINLTMWGFNQAPRTIDGIDMQGASIYVVSQYNFTIIIDWSAAFDFDNKGGNSASIVRFILKEDATKYLSYAGRALGILGTIVVTPIAPILLIAYLHMKERTRSTPPTTHTTNQVSIKLAFIVGFIMYLLILYVLLWHPF